MGAVEESDTFFLEFGVLLQRTAKGIRLGELTLLGDYSMAGGGGVGIGMEGMAHSAGVTGAESSSNFPIGGDFAFWNIADKSIDLVEKSHKLIIAET